MPLSFMHEEHIFSYICVHVPVRSLYVLKSRILCVYNMNVCALLLIHHESGIFMDIMMDYTISDCWPTRDAYRMGV